MAVTNKPKREGIMLCYPAEQKRVEKLGNNFFTQPKLKGERCRVEWFHNEPVLLTSQANEFKYVDHIKQALKDNFKHNKSPLDGEIYVHGWSEEKIRSVAGRKVNEHSESSKLQFHVLTFSCQFLSGEEFKFFKSGIKKEDLIVYSPMYQLK